MQPGSACSPITAATSRQGWKPKPAACRRTSFVYHDGELLQEEGREEQDTSYHLGAGMEAFRRGQELSYYHRDEQLSTVFVTDGQGEIRNSYQYDAFGIPP